ncbi:hypothetical protein Ancab_016213 [Ancistrocladus abbreviatus]
MESILANPLPTAVVLGVLSLLLLVFMRRSRIDRTRVSHRLPPTPKIRGLPLIGNLLQLKEKKPFKTFTRWAEIYGPIYSIQLGSSRLIVLNNADVAREAMVTRYTSISTRKLSYALTTLTNDKFMVAMSDYGEFHKRVKRHILIHLLGPNAQKRIRHYRESMISSIMDRLYDHVKYSSFQAVNFREIYQSELFCLALKEVLGFEGPSIYVEDLGTTLTRNEMLHVLVLDMMDLATEVDWRDFFPYLRWVPNKKVETKIRSADFRRHAVMKALIEEHRRKTNAGKEINCYLNLLLSEEKMLTEKQLAMLAWEPVVETSDTTLITTEWAMFEIAKDPERQDLLYQEIQRVCGLEKITEEHLSKLPYLGAIFHETLRKHSPVPIIPPRHVSKDTQIGGYHIPAGSEIAINLYGCNRDKNQWKDPEEWNPERFLEDRYDPQDLYKTMAFGAGKRACAGSLQAMLIACSSIGRLVQEFEWKLKDGEAEDLNTVGLTTYKLHPLHAIIQPRR